VHAPGMAMVFRREVLAAAAVEDRPPSRYGGGQRMLHDELVFFLAGALGPIRLVAEPLVLYRQHGFNASSGPLDGLRHRTLRPALDNYRRIAEHNAACAAYLARAGDVRLAAATREYQRMAANWDLRESLYGATDRRTRARMLRRLVAGRAYEPRARGGFGHAALAKDLVAGIALRLSGSSRSTPG
jgi:hypothetical protein